LGMEEAKFADDFNRFKAYIRYVTNRQILENLRECQERVHQWVLANRVLFDLAKEAFVILHRVDNYGEPFRLLGAHFDTQLRMHEAIEKLVSKTAPKLTALLRGRRYHTMADMINQYKAHILCILESISAAIFHACDTGLERLDRVQNRFLREMELSPERAFLEFNMGPLRLRRDTAMLSLVHKCVLGVAHQKLCNLFPLDSSEPHRFCTRLASKRHDRQVVDRCNGSHSTLLANSIFGCARVYNLLPQAVVDAKSVSTFQSALTNYSRSLCKQGDPTWLSSFSTR